MTDKIVYHFDYELVPRVQSHPFRNELADLSDKADAKKSYPTCEESPLVKSRVLQTTISTEDDVHLLKPLSLQNIALQSLINIASYFSLMERHLILKLVSKFFCAAVRNLENFPITKLQNRREKIDRIIRSRLDKRGGYRPSEMFTFFGGRETFLQFPVIHFTKAELKSLKLRGEDAMTHNESLYIRKLENISASIAIMACAVEKPFYKKCQITYCLFARIRDLTPVNPISSIAMDFNGGDVYLHYDSGGSCARYLNPDQYDDEMRKYFRDLLNNIARGHMEFEYYRSGSGWGTAYYDRRIEGPRFTNDKATVSLLRE